MVASPTRIVEWRRIVAAESTVPSSPANVASQSSLFSSAEPTTYGSGSTWSITRNMSVSREVPDGARMKSLPTGTRYTFGSMARPSAVGMVRLS